MLRILGAPPHTQITPAPKNIMKNAKVFGHSLFHLSNLNSFCTLPSYVSLGAHTKDKGTWSTFHLQLGRNLPHLLSIGPLSNNKNNLTWHAKPWWMEYALTLILAWNWIFSSEQDKIASKQKRAIHEKRWISIQFSALFKLLVLWIYPVCRASPPVRTTFFEL